MKTCTERASGADAPSLIQGRHIMVAVKSILAVIFGRILLPAVIAAFGLGASFLLLSTLA
jgi:hypothetical protein